ncbi:uncharacterized protein LOC129372824 [Poeciliopsis prolifica]|uniref:uncharacterized protein LOC129372824 n=1 Tax=Poeciliopsis prolifica TaxID=188132 RepID=UPI002413A69F|nr:uncharacterized protein LOC129372824 [Poeciliopsis prolifica]
MKNIFLLIILISDFEASGGTKRCPQNGTEFTCRQPKSKNVKIFISTINSEQNNHNDKCEERFNSLLFQYKTKNCSLTVMLTKPHIGMIEVKADSCSSSAKTSKKPIICNYPNQNQSKFQSRCRSQDFVCDKFSPQSHSEFTESIHKACPFSDGLYSCKMEERKTEKPELILKVTDIVTFTKSPVIGENLTFFCKYDDDKDQKLEKFVCKGEKPTKCEVVISTKTADKTCRFTMQNNKKGNITITIKDVRAIDSGTYWCGARKKHQQSEIFISRLFLDAVTTPTSLPTSTTSSHIYGGLSSGVKTSFIIIAAGGTLILLVIVTFCLYKRCLRSEKAENSSAEQHPREDCIYEEIPLGLQTKVGNAHATVNFSPNDPASLHYCTINFQSGSTKTTDGEVQIMEPSSSSCQYSFLKLSKNLASLSDPPTKSTGEPLYSAVKK